MSRFFKAAANSWGLIRTVRILFPYQLSSSVSSTNPELISQDSLVFIAANRNGMLGPFEGLRLIRYETCREQHRPSWLQRFHDAIEEGQAVYDALDQLYESGWHPDWIINHVVFEMAF